MIHDGDTDRSVADAFVGNLPVLTDLTHPGRVNERAPANDGGTNREPQQQANCNSSESRGNEQLTAGGERI